jgi:hypothetical protein
MQMASEFVGWKHFISLRIQITFGGKGFGI